MNPLPPGSRDSPGGCIVSEKCPERAVELGALATCAEGSGLCQGQPELDQSPGKVEGTNKSAPRWPLPPGLV